jgi:hypothetical protein
MLLTVLIVLASATIAALVVQVAVTAAGSQQRRLAATSARDEVNEITSRVSSLFASDPTRVFDEVLDGEDPRLCVADPVGVPGPVAAGDPWPSTCGAYWEYAPASTGESGFRLHPPRLDRPDFLLEVFARVAGERSGRLVHLLPGGRERPVLYSGSDLAFADLGLDVTGPGTIYVDGSLDPGAETFLSGTRLAAEGGFVTEPENAVLLSPADLPTADPTDIRALYPSRLSSGVLRSALTTISALACPSVDPVALDAYVTSFCVAEGRSLLDVDGNLVAVPSRADAPYLLLLPDAASKVTLYARAAAPASWPGALAGWGTPLGTFELPVTGLIHADRTVVLGACEPVDGVCAARSADAAPGFTADVSITLTAGSTELPADVVLGSPVRRGTGAVGVLASRLVLPAAATPPGTSLAVEGFFALTGRPGEDLVVTGSGDSTGARPSVSVSGSLLLARPAVSLPAFSAAALLLDADPSAPTPWMPSPGLLLAADRFEELSSAALLTLLP